MIMHNDHFQNRKQYNIPKAQLVLTDIPYNLGNNAYASNPKGRKSYGFEIKKEFVKGFEEKLSKNFQANLF